MLLIARVPETRCILNTQAMTFYDRANTRIRNKYLVIKDKAIDISNSIKYLGLIIDHKWSFSPHFEAISTKVDRVLGYLCNIMLNTRGADEGRRKLYVNVIYSIMLYGSPIWSNSFMENTSIKGIFYKITRRLAQRVCRAYQTVSRVSAVLVSSIVPPEMVARRQAAVYHKIKEANRRGIALDYKTREILLRNSKKDSLEDWKRTVERMREGDSGARIRKALMPAFDEWYGRKHRRVTFHMTQVLSGHGCFNSFLYKIKKANSPDCDHCDMGEDTARHTLEECPCWLTERNELRDCIGNNLDLGYIVSTIVIDIEKWNSFSKFCSVVISKKEEAERIRQAAAVDDGLSGFLPQDGAGHYSDSNSD